MLLTSKTMISLWVGKGSILVIFHNALMSTSLVSLNPHFLDQLSKCETRPMCLLIGEGEICLFSFCKCFHLCENIVPKQCFQISKYDLVLCSQTVSMFSILTSPNFIYLIQITCTKSFVSKNANNHSSKWSDVAGLEIP